MTSRRATPTACGISMGIAPGNSSPPGENSAYSPVNLYMALAMLADTCDGESRDQILDLLGADSIESLRTQAGQVWNANYCDDGALTSVLANSIWLSEDSAFNGGTLSGLARNYYASSFTGSSARIR